MRLLLLSIFLSIYVLPGYAQTYTVSGYVVDADTRETLIGVTVFVKETANGTITDGNGFFRLGGLKPGEYTLQFTYIGYEKTDKKIDIINRSKLLNETSLKQKIVELGDVTIIGIKPDSTGDKEVETSQLKISSRTIQYIPAAGGDVFRAIKYLPGLDATEPFSPLYSARGSDPAGNLVLLDGVAIYNPYHFTTADGLFNYQTIKDVDVMVGGFGAEYGGRNASILYITTKDGNMNKLHGEIEPTTTHSKLFLEFPIGRRSSMIIAGRYHYDIPGYFLYSTKSYFCDLNISYTSRLNERNRFTIKLFDSRDNFKYNPDRLFAYLGNTFDIDTYDDIDISMRNYWTNQVATAYLKTIISPNIYLKTQVYGSFHTANNFSGLNFYYKPDTDRTLRLIYNTLFISKINDGCAKTVLNIKLDTINTLKLGVEINSYHFNNSARILDIDKGNNIRSPSLYSGFFEDKVRLGKFIIRPGLRVSNYSYRNKWQYEPRINMVLGWPSDIKIKAAWGIYYQDIISMNTQEYELSQFLDYYYPLKNNNSSRSVHYILGFEKPVFSSMNLSADLYYIDMPVTYTFDLNQNELEARTFSDKLIKGTGKSYGVEINLKGEFKKLTGWMSYRLCRSTRSYPNIMNGKSFLFDFDRKHSFKAVLNYNITSNVTYNISLLVQSGLPKTLESTLQNHYYYNSLTGELSTYPFGVSAAKNNARLPVQTELDIGIIKRIRSGFGADLAEFIKADQSYFTMTFGNLLFFRRNVLYYYPYGEEKYLPVGINYFPTISVGYIIKF